MIQVLRIAMFVFWSALSAFAQDTKGAQTLLPSLERGPQLVIVTFEDASSRQFIADLETETLTAEARARRIDQLPQLYSALKSRAALATIPGVRLAQEYSHLPIAVFTIDSREALLAVVAQPLVKSVDPVRAHQRSLMQSLPLIGVRTAQLFGHSGRGTTVAILDTGLDYRRAAFGCIRPGEPANCRVIVAEDAAPNDGMLDEADLHGTNVAGIIAAVARDTRIISYDVFDGAQARDPDILKALNWVIRDQARYNIVAVNMSLNIPTQGYMQFCEAGFTGYTAAFRQLRAVGVIPVVSSGNRARTNGIEAPSCVPGAVSVGAVYDSNVGAFTTAVCSDQQTMTDKVACFSNSAPILTLLAPGAIIDAAGLLASGTSQAAPHVVGAIALIRAADPSLSHRDVERLLVTRGKKITDHRNAITTPRIDLPETLTPYSVGIVAFEKPVFQGIDADGFVTITITRKLGSKGAVTVGYETADGTAVQGVDYEATQGTVGWAHGDLSPKTFRIGLKRNPAMPCDAKFTVRINASTGFPIFFDLTTQVVIQQAKSTSDYTLEQRDPDWNGPPREDNKMVHIENLVPSPRGGVLLAAGAYKITSYLLGGGGRIGYNGATQSYDHFPRGLVQPVISLDGQYAYVASGFTWPVVGHVTTVGAVNLHPRPSPPPANGCFSGIAAAPDNFWVYASDPCYNRLGMYVRSPATGDLSLMKMYSSADPGMPAQFNLRRLDISEDGRILVAQNDDALFVMRRRPDSGYLIPYQTFQWPAPLGQNDGYAYARSGRHWIAVRGSMLYVLRQQSDDYLALVSTLAIEHVKSGVGRQRIAISRDLRRVALIGSNGIVSFRFDPSTDQLTPIPGYFPPPRCEIGAQAQIVSLAFSLTHDVLYAGWTAPKHGGSDLSGEVAVLKYTP